MHPTRKKKQSTKRVMDLLLGREIRELFNMGYETARTIGVEPTIGFILYHARARNKVFMEYVTISSLRQLNGSYTTY